MRELDYRIGLDIGTNSVGWSVIGLELNENNVYEKESIIDLGVRMFDKAEIPKTGASLAEPRRLARSSRRRLHRRSERKKEIRKLLISHGVINKKELEILYPLSQNSIDIWDIRIEALDRLLNNFEWTRLLIHLAQRRGFKSNRKSELNDKETGAVLSSIKQNKQCLLNYRTVGEMWMNDQKFKENGRRHNSNGEFIFNVSRYDLEQEIITLFEVQRQLNSPYATIELQEAYLKVWNHQLPFASGNAILKKVGECSLEKNERRIPKASYTFQYFVALDKINRIRIGKDIQPLTEEQRMILLNQLFNRTNLPKKPPTIKYSDIRKWLKLNEENRFNDITYDSNEKLSKSEDIPFINLNPYYEIKRITDETGDLFTVKDFDAIGFALTIYKTDKDIYNYLKNPNNLANKVFTDELIDELLHLSYSKFGHLSLKAIQNLLPIMEKGLTFKQAAEEFGYDTTGLKKTNREVFLPLIPDDITNPVVKRALSQSRKVVNAIIKRYGSPISVHIELARELSKNSEDRKKIEKAQSENYERNKGALKVLAENGILHPTGHDIVRYKLWQEQDERCAYSLNKIPATIFFKELKRERNSSPSLEVDHILPYSKSFLDSYQNRVLVYSDENRKKGNRIPYDYLKENQLHWERYENEVNNNKKYSKKKKQLLTKKEFSENEERLLKERHLNDTRFASRFFKNFVEQNLKFKEIENSQYKRRVETVSGQITAHVRKRWGLEKSRDKTHLHHALDAVVVACTDASMIKQITEYHKLKESTKNIK